MTSKKLKHLTDELNTVHKLYEVKVQVRVIPTSQNIQINYNHFPL